MNRSVEMISSLKRTVSALALGAEHAMDWLNQSLSSTFDAAVQLDSWLVGRAIVRIPPAIETAELCPQMPNGSEPYVVAHEGILLAKYDCPQGHFVAWATLDARRVRCRICGVAAATNIVHDKVGRIGGPRVFASLSTSSNFHVFRDTLVARHECRRHGFVGFAPIGTGIQCCDCHAPACVPRVHLPYENIAKVPRLG